MQSHAVEKDAIVVGRSAPAEQQTPHRLPLLTGGLHTDKPPAELAPNEAVEMSGVHLVAGRLVVDTGYVPFSHEFIGAAQLELQIKFADATSIELLVTSALVYKYVAAAVQWQLISKDSVRAVTSTQGSGNTVIPIDDTTGISAGSYVGITLDDGSQLITQVVGIPVPLNIQITNPIPAGRTANGGAAVALGVALNGDPTRWQVCSTFYAANAWIVFSNGVDPIMYYDHAIDAVIALPGLPANTTCAAMTTFHGMLLLGNTTENGTALPQRVRQSDIGDPTGWDPGVDGVAAIYDLLDTPDSILNLKLLGPWVICYREATVMRGSFIGALNEIIFWEYMSQADGIQSQGAVADVGSSHVIVGTNNVYEYRGDYTLPPIGEAVFQNFLAKSGDIYAPSKQTLFCVYVPTLREVWILYPSSAIAPPPATPLYPNKTLRFNTQLRCWQEREFADEFISAGAYVPQDTITWATAQGQWDDVIWARPWNSRTNIQNVPNLFLGPPTQTQVYVYDFASMTDRGAAIWFAVTTREFGDGSLFTRWERVTLTGIGTADVAYSVDQGEIWTPLGQITLGAEESSQTLWLDVSSTRLMLRLTGNDQEFELHYATIYSEFDSEW